MKRCSDNSFFARFGDHTLTIDPANEQSVMWDKKQISMGEFISNPAATTSYEISADSEVTIENGLIKLVYHSKDVISPYWTIEWAENKNNKVTAHWYPRGALFIAGAKCNTSCAFKDQSVHFCAYSNIFQDIAVYSDNFTVNAGSLVATQNCKIISPVIFNLGYLGDQEYRNIRNAKQNTDSFWKLEKQHSLQNFNSYNAFVIENFELFKNNNWKSPGFYNLGTIGMMKNNMYLEDQSINLIDGYLETEKIVQTGDNNVMQIGDSSNKNVIKAALNANKNDISNTKTLSLAVKIGELSGTKSIFSNSVSNEDFDGNNNLISIKNCNDARIYPLSKETDELKAPTFSDRYATNVETIKETLLQVLHSNAEPDDAELISNCRLYHEDGSLLRKEHLVQNFKFKLGVGCIKDIAEITGNVTANQELELKENQETLTGLIYEICKRQIERIYNNKQPWQGLHRENDWAEISLAEGKVASVYDVYSHLFGTNAEDCETQAETYFENRPELQIELGKVNVLQDDDNPTFDPLSKSETFQNEFRTRIYVNFGNNKRAYVATVLCSIAPDNTVHICEYKTGVPVTLAGTKLIVEQLNKIRKKNVVDNRENNNYALLKEAAEKIEHIYGGDKETYWYSSTRTNERNNLLLLEKCDIETQEFKIQFNKDRSSTSRDTITCRVDNGNNLHILPSSKYFTPKYAEQLLKELNEIWKQEGGEDFHFKSVIVDPLPIYFDNNSFKSGEQIPLPEIYEVAKRRRVYADICVQSSETDSNGQPIYVKIPVWFMVANPNRSNGHSCIFFDLNDRPLSTLHDKLGQLLGISWRENDFISSQSGNSLSETDNTSTENRESHQPNSIQQRIDIFNQGNAMTTLKGNTFGMF